MRRLVILLLVMSVLLPGCRKCLKGHHETVVVPAHYENQFSHFMYVGDVMIPVYHYNVYVPERKYLKFVCDQYEETKSEPVHY